MRLTLVLGLLLAFAVPAQAAWPGFHNDARHTGLQSGTAYQKFEESWWRVKIDPGTQVDASPIVADGYVVVAGWDGIVRVLDAQSGAEKWQVTLSKIVGTPVAAGGTLFVVTEGGLVQSYDLDRGTPLYSAQVGQTLGSLTYHEGKLFIGNEGGVMHAFYADTMTVMWTFAVNSISSGYTTDATTGAKTCKAALDPRPIRGAPVVHEGKVIFGSMNGWVYAVNEQGQANQKTQPQWIYQTNDAIFGSPAVDSSRNRVLIGSYDEKMHALPTSPSGSGPVMVGANNDQLCSAKLNTPAWKYTVPSNFGSSKVESTPAVDGTKAYFGANNGRVYALYLSNGTKAWEFVTGAAVVSSPAVSNGLVVAGSDDGKLYWLRASNGDEVTSFILDSAVKASPALDGNKTYIVSSEGAIHMLGPKIPLRPDLRVASITYDGQRLSFLVQNDGTGEAAASTLRVLLDGSFIADVPVPTVAAASSVSVTHEVDLDGTHVVSATADSANAVTESQESNNAFDQSVTQTGGGGGAGKKDDKGFIPGPGVPLAFIGLGLAGLMLRRKR